jgi:hypothetical protein
MQFDDNVADTQRRIGKLEIRLAEATRRELKRLARVLTYKADVYGPQGRIYSHTAKWEVRDGVLWHGSQAYDPDTLCDGHGRTIDAESMY